MHDYLTQLGGGEKVLKEMTEIWPKADIFTLIYQEKFLKDFLKDKKVYASFLQKFPFAKTKHRLYPWLMPLAIEHLDLDGYDLVISSSASFAKGVITGPDTLHVCYCHTPMRFAWDDCHKAIKEFNYSRFLKKLIPFAMNYIRMWDDISSDSPDYYVANSEFVRRRIKKYYQKEALVIHPPVEVERFRLSKKDEGYYLMVGRLLPYKRFDLGVKAFTKLGWKLKIVGEGPEMKRIKKGAGKNIEFLGWVDDKELPSYFENARAFVFTGEEDFGIVAVEAMASGKPVIAYKAGGVLEIIKEGKTGMFFERQRVEDLEKTLLEFDKKRDKFKSEEIRVEALKFKKEVFREKFFDFVENKLKERKYGDRL